MAKRRKYALSTKAKRHMEDLIEEENKNNGIKKDK